MLVGKGAWIYLFIGIVLFVSSLPRGVWGGRKRERGGGGNERKTQLYKPTALLFAKENHSFIGVYSSVFSWYYKVR
jgi:hypothetical protein